MLLLSFGISDSLGLTPPPATLRAKARTCNCSGSCTPYCMGCTESYGKIKLLLPSRFERPRTYWITTFCCCVFTPPLVFCAVMLMMLSPLGKGGMK